mgnify:CR=1 FL=1|jgi:hypothetical protein
MSENTYNPEDEKKVQEADGFKCPACGGTTVFDPESQALKCEYCHAIHPIDKIEGTIEEKDFFLVDESKNQNWGSKTRVVKCKSCGGETVMEANDISTRCAFCTSPQVVDTKELPGIKPESVLPFKIDKDSAKSNFKTWISKRFWAPRAIKKYHEMEKTMKGIYVPHWTYDSQTFSRYAGQAGNYYYITQTYTVMVDGRPQRRTRQVQKIRWFPVAGNYDKFFDDVLVNDSTNIDQKIMQIIQPFDLKLLTKYSAKYLVGFAAEKYSKGVKAIWESAKSIIRQRIKNNIHAIILRSADVVGNLNINTDYKGVTYKHMLLPVWISAYKFRGKLYSFYINGQTGEVQGKAPVSFWKVLIAVIIAAALIYLISLWVTSSGAV